MFRFGRSMNPSWDQELALTRMDALGIPLRRKVKALSGGQQAQVALTMALAKRAPLLALDEPVASLDPIARLEFMRDVLAASADSGLTVIIASHVISELERFCDWLLVLTGGRLQLAGPVDDLLAGHALLTVPRRTPDSGLPGKVISRMDSDRHSTVLVAADPARLAAGRQAGWQAGWEAEPAGFEQLVLAYLQRPPLGAPAADHALAGGGCRAMIWVTWRQHRPQAIAMAALFCALAVFAVVIGAWMRTTFSADGLGACLAHSGGTGCAGTITSFVHKFNGAATLPVNILLFAIPGCWAPWWAPRCSARNSSAAPGSWPGARPCRGPGGWSPSWCSSPAGWSCSARRSPP